MILPIGSLDLAGHRDYRPGMRIELSITRSIAHTLFAYSRDRLALWQRRVARRRLRRVRLARPALG